MITAEQILVVYLSIALAVFLTLGIIVLAYAIKIVTQVSRVSDKVEQVVDNAGEAMENFRRTTLLASAGNSFSRLVKDFFAKTKHDSSKDDGKEDKG